MRLLKAVDILIFDIQRQLTPDLLNGIYKTDSDNPLRGHCYVATETIYWILRDKPNYKSYKPYVLTHKEWPTHLKPGETHWYLMSSNLDVIDATAQQFNVDIDDIPHWKGKPNGMMNHPIGGSKRSRILRSRLSI